MKVRLTKNAQKCYVVSSIFLLKVHISPLQHSTLDKIDELLKTVQDLKFMLGVPTMTN